MIKTRCWRTSTAPTIEDRYSSDTAREENEESEDYQEYETGFRKNVQSGTQTTGSVMRQRTP